MRLSSFKLGSLRLSSILTLAACIGLGAANAGCIIVADRDPSGLEQVTVDADSTMDVVSGDDIGVFVEYTSGGHWEVFTTCDTTFSDAACPFDVYITPEEGAGISSAIPRDLDGGDVVELLDDGSVHLQTDTTFGFPGVAFDSDPGALIQVELRFEGRSAPEYFFAVSYGSVQEGASTNPAEFVPDLP